MKLIQQIKYAFFCLCFSLLCVKYSFFSIFFMFVFFVLIPLILQKLVPAPPFIRQIRVGMKCKVLLAFFADGGSIAIDVYAQTL